MAFPESPGVEANAASGYSPVESLAPREPRKTSTPSKDPTDGIRQTWKKYFESQKYSVSPRLEERVRNGLYIPIETALHDAVTAGKENTRSTVQKIWELLGEQGIKDGIDDCVRWLVLAIAIDKTDFPDPRDHGREAQRPAQDEPIEMEHNIDVLITRIIIALAPHLAFQTPNRLEKCKAKSKGSRLGVPHGPIKNRKSTPFHQAARNGNAKAIKHMIYHGLRSRETQAVQAHSLERRPAAQDHSGILDSHSTCGVTTAHESLLNILKEPDPLSSRSFPETALHLAAVAEEGGSGALGVLLSFDTRLADSPDNTFTQALKDGNISVVDQFLEHERLRGIFGTSDNLLQALDQLGIAEQNATSYADNKDALLRRRDIVFRLMNCATSSRPLDEDVIDKIIQLDLDKVWELASEKMSPQLNKNGLLHRAVLHQNLSFVTKFLNKYPNSVTYRSPLRKNEQVIACRKECFPLWHNNKVIGEASLKDRTENEFPKRKEIREVIVTATIKNKNIKKLRDLPDIFQDSSETVSELCFDLSRFNSRAYPVSNFVRSLINHSENPNLLSYEHTIKYAEFPALDLSPEEKETFGPEGLAEHTEVFEILEWLKKDKGVREIIQLKVPDRLVSPHNEDKIARHVKDFKVEVLDWRFLDMAISIFDDDTRKRIKELHLYASGKRAAISHWLSAEGVASLENLKLLEINVIKDVMTEYDCNSTASRIQSQFGDLPSKLGRKELVIRVARQRWNPSHERLADLEEIAERAVPKLSGFIKKYRAYVQIGAQPQSIKFRPTRVAIIDNGILSIAPKAESNRELFSARQGPDRFEESDDILKSQHVLRAVTGEDRLSESVGPRNYKTLWSRIKTGRSFVDDGLRLSPWLFASDPHGTQMANVICAIDPLCELYVAQVTDGRSGITPSRVARAINWAISQNVDVISMSIATHDVNNDLKQACVAASNLGILMFASSHDEGSNVGDAYPASLAQTITIAAVDDFGTELRPSGQNYDYGISGEEIAAGVVPFLESDDRVSGSSVATAIAAGLSSLILSCDRLAQPSQEHREALGRRSAVCEHHFKKMTQESEKLQLKKHILLEKFGGIDVKLKDGLDISVNQILTQSFNTVDYSR